MSHSVIKQEASVKVYHGYGHTQDLVVYGHVFKDQPDKRHNYTNNAFTNIAQLLRLFFITPLPNARVQLLWRSQLLEATAADDGFFKFEWASNDDVEAGWHSVSVRCVDGNGAAIASGEGKLFVPHATQYAFISDIDDTVLISHSSTIGRRLRLMFTKNPRTRRAFDDVVHFYEMLALSHTTPDLLNPFFYVSSSEWNLYNDLNEFFTFNGLPKGIFLLNTLKRWYQLFKTGKTKHEGKLLRVMRIISTFPKQQFILLGDNSQSDPLIYESIVSKYPEKVYAVFIRNIHPNNEQKTTDILAAIKGKDVHAFLYKDSVDAIACAKEIGLIEA